MNAVEATGERPNRQADDHAPARAVRVRYWSAPLLLAMLAAGFAVAASWPKAASAHRNGCHRWHSCPSDTGSYECGDLGYHTYCPASGGGGGGTTQPRPRRRKRAQTIKARITRVIDGDTIRVKPLERTRRSAYRVRLIGIDTPETRKPGTPVECGGKQATSSMLDVGFTSPRDTDGDGLSDARGGRGARVTLKTDPTQSRFDRYGRLLAYAKRRDGRTLAGIQLKRGWARVYVFRKRFRLYRQFRAIQAGARDAERGVWGLCGGRFHTPA